MVPLATLPNNITKFTGNCQ